MNRLFLDTNVILDLLAHRDPHYDSIARLATLADQKKLVLVCSPISFTTIDFILNKYESEDSVRSKLRKFKIICEVAEVNEESIEKGLNAPFKDFEDAVQYYCALQANCSIIITRNSKDFKHASIPVMSAEAFLKR
jgi:predicted nucleic acid-binding protein